MQKHKKSGSKLIKYLLVFALFLGITSRIVYLKMVNPSGINEVSSGMVATSGITLEEQARLDYSSTTRPGVKLPNGCVSKQVQCVKAPCPAIWSCPPGVTPPPTTTPQPSCVTRPTCPEGKMCATVALREGQVFCDQKPVPTPPANCTSWFDGCNTCSVENGVIKGCTKMACKDTTKPPSCLAYNVAVPSKPPSCTCPPGAMCKLSAECMRPSPSPVPMGLGSFSATKACGANSFSVVSYTCQKDKTPITLANGVCTDMYSALKKAISYCGTQDIGVIAK